MRNFSRFVLRSGKKALRFEPWILLVLVLAFIGSFSGMVWDFYVHNTELVPAEGGTYIEGTIGELQPLNPWFTVTNDANRDIVSLVFSGLLRYNPETKEIEDDLGTLKMSNDGRVYTVTLKDNLFWHDSTLENPHRVTAEDVLFTFKTIQDPEFSNPLLRQNFEGVTITQINEKTVQFRLEQPYSFFPSNLTLGLLPRRSFEGIPAGRLHQALEFGFNPIGAGPYRFKSIIQTELSTEVTLERFDRKLPPEFLLERIVFRIFPDYSALLSDLRNLDGIRIAPRTDQGSPVIPNRFMNRPYTLPQYVALFFNLDRPILQDTQLRLGLQLGTNKQEIIDDLHETSIVDTPLLEIDTSDWRYQFDPVAAQGALFESQWYFPEKIRLQRLLEQRDANLTGDLQMNPILLLDTGAILTLTGTLTDTSLTKSVNGIPLSEHPTNSGAWIVSFPTDGSTGSILTGLNVLRLTDARGQILDSYYLWRTTDSREYARASEEQRVVELFVESKSESLPEDQRITASDVFLDQGRLRLRKESDPTGIRRNDTGELLELTILTSSSPPYYKDIAHLVAKEWKDLGIQVTVEVPDTRQEFEERLLKREYDVLLFGQSLLDNLDSYPYWHSSGVQKLTGERKDLRLDAYNLSQYASFEADALLKTIRETTSETERKNALETLRERLKQDVPAIFLYSPTYNYAHREDLHGISLGALSLHSDRFLTLHGWYLREERRFTNGTNWFDLPFWVFSHENSARTDIYEPELQATGAILPIDATGSTTVE